MTCLLIYLIQRGEIRSTASRAMLYESDLNILSVPPHTLTFKVILKTAGLIIMSLKEL